MRDTMTIETPVGALEVSTAGDVLVSARFVDGGGAATAIDDIDTLAPAPLLLFQAYFRGELDALDKIEVALAGSPFQLRVWHALRDIPAGEVASYAEIASAIGHPRAARAVGQANHANNVVIAVPCHRVVTASRHIGGYGGGVAKKEWLLAHERVRDVRLPHLPGV